MSQRRLALLGTHDLVAHAAGVRADAWPDLQRLGSATVSAIRSYLAGVERPTIAALVLPYTVGVVLDDLAQPVSYGSKSHLLVLELLLDQLRRATIPADAALILTEFPPTFQAVIEASRDPGITATPEVARERIRQMIREVAEHSLEWRAT